jgi:hypothetical protein
MLSEELVASSVKVVNAARPVAGTRQHAIARSAGRLERNPKCLRQIEFILVVGLVLAFATALQITSRN